MCLLIMRPMVEVSGEGLGESRADENKAGTQDQYANLIEDGGFWSWYHIEEVWRLLH